MADEMAQLIAMRIQRIHGQLLDVTTELSDDQIAWSPQPHAPSIGFQLWHTARCADRMRERLPSITADLKRRLGAAQQVWHTDELARRWCLDAASLGPTEIGREMDEAAVATLVLPGRETLVAYARQVFASADRAVAAVEDRDFPVVCQDLAGTTTTVGPYLLDYLTHASRHLGMVECLRGLQGLRGTATR